MEHDPRMQLGEAALYRPSDRTFHCARQFVGCMFGSSGAAIARADAQSDSWGTYAIDLDIERKPVSALYIAQLDAAGALAGAPKMLEVQGSRYVTALAFLRSDDSKYLCTTHMGLAYLDSNTGVLSHLPNGLGEIISSEQEGEKMRFNDAVADSHGRFYFHSMSKDESRKSGKLYLYDPKTMKGKDDLKVLEENFAIGNGPAIDEERRRFYFNVTSEGIGCESRRSCYPT